MASLVAEITQRLITGGWTKIREGAHPVWAHPNGARISVPTTVKDTGRRKLNYFKQIERGEATGDIHETTGVTPAPSAAPAPEPKPVAVAPVSLLPVESDEDRTKRLRAAFAKLPQAERLLVAREQARVSRAVMGKAMATQCGGQWCPGLVRKSENGVYVLTASELKCWLLQVGVEDYDGFYAHRPDAALAELEETPTPVQEDPKPPCFTPNPEAIVAALTPDPQAAAIDREALIERVTARLRSPRLTDAEVLKLTDDLDKAVINVLLS